MNCCDKRLTTQRNIKKTLFTPEQTQRAIFVDFRNCSTLFISLLPLLLCPSSPTAANDYTICSRHDSKRWYDGNKTTFNDDSSCCGAATLALLMMRHPPFRWDLQFSAVNKKQSRKRRSGWSCMKERRVNQHDEKEVRSEGGKEIFMRKINLHKKMLHSRYFHSFFISLRSELFYSRLHIWKFVCRRCTKNSTGKVSFAQVIFSRKKTELYTQKNNENFFPSSALRSLLGGVAWDF